MTAQTIYSSAAHRCSDAVNVHILGQGDGVYGKWVAVKLEDGRSDGVLYDRKRDAVRHQLHETQCAYICIPPGGMTPRQAENFLRFQRALYDMGCRIADPDKDTDLILPFSQRFF
jgi:hypothetical protein